MNRQYICSDCNYKWKSRKSFGTPSVCPNCKNNNIIKYEYSKEYLKINSEKIEKIEKMERDMLKTKNASKKLEEFIKIKTIIKLNYSFPAYQKYFSTRLAGIVLFISVFLACTILVFLGVMYTSFWGILIISLPFLGISYIFTMISRKILYNAYGSKEYENDFNSLSAENQKLVSKGNIKELEKILEMRTKQRKIIIFEDKTISFNCPYCDTSAKTDVNKVLKIGDSLAFTCEVCKLTSKPIVLKIEKNKQ